MAGTVIFSVGHAVDGTVPILPSVLTGYFHLYFSSVSAGSPAIFCVPVTSFSFGDTVTSGRLVWLPAIRFTPSHSCRKYRSGLAGRFYSHWILYRRTGGSDTPAIILLGHRHIVRIARSILGRLHHIIGPCLNPNCLPTHWRIGQSLRHGPFDTNRVRTR